MVSNVGGVADANSLSMMRRYFTRGVPFYRWFLLAAFAVGCINESRAVDEAGVMPRITGARIGFKNHFKLGCWTAVTADVEGVPDDATATRLQVQVHVPDSDGVLTTAAGRLATTVDETGHRSAVVYTQVGRVGSPIRLTLVENDKTIGEITLLPAAKEAANSVVNSIPATNEVLVSLGTRPFGLGEAFGDRPATSDAIGRKLIELDGIRDLPAEWFGYLGIDLLLLPAGDGRLMQELGQDSARMEAIERWVQLGGRVIVFCGARSAEAMLAPKGPLARFAPGKFAEVVRLPDSSPIEHYAGQAASIGGGVLEVPRLTDVRGSIEVFGDRRATEVPLVVRSPRGFGEIVFVGLEFGDPPLNTWSGRTAFLRAVLRPYLAETAGIDASQKLVTVGFNDLSGALRQRLGRSFPQVIAIGFPIVAGLAIAYLVCLGPFDYFLTHRLLRRPLAGWITLPIIVTLFAIAAFAIGQWSRGSAKPRVNQAEVIDFDTIDEQVRGTFWAVAFSPNANEFDFKFEPPKALGQTASSVETLFSWWGLPGVGIGGMQTGGDLGIVRGSYSYGDDRNELEGVPVLASATKSLLARWATKSATKLDTELNDVDGLVEGAVTNQTSVTLRNARLLYGTWAYRLGNLAPGERIEIGEQLSPLNAKTIVTREAFGETRAGQTEGRVFSAEQASPKDLLNLMMFYETAGGFGFAHVPNRFQSFVDLSRQLELGRAVLVAEIGGPHSQLQETASNQPVDSEAADSAMTVYRFILPVKHEAAPQK